MAKQINTKKFEYQDFSPPPTKKFVMIVSKPRQIGKYVSVTVYSLSKNLIQKTAPPDPGN